MYIPKPNTGTLWPNEKKYSDNHPDVRGDINMDKTFLKNIILKTEGELVKISISGWKKNISGKDCFSLAASEPYVNKNGGRSQLLNVAPTVVDDDIPF